MSLKILLKNKLFPPYLICLNSPITHYFIENSSSVLLKIKPIKKLLIHKLKSYPAARITTQPGGSNDSCDGKFRFKKNATVALLQ